MIYILIILSFILEAVLSNIISIPLLTPLFLIVSLTISYPYFKNNKFNFVMTCALTGLIYDISFSDSLYINTISFGLLSAIVIIGYDYLKYNIINCNIINVIVIIFYRIISYLLLCFIDYINFNFKLLLEGIYNSLILNIIYATLIYLILHFTSKLFKTK